MNKRKCKKQAKQFLEGKRKFPTKESAFSYDTDGNYVYKVEYVIPERIRRIVYDIAYSFGWDGAHWDAPDLVGCYDNGEWFPNLRWGICNVPPLPREPMERG